MLDGTVTRPRCMRCGSKLTMTSSESLPQRPLGKAINSGTPTGGRGAASNCRAHGRGGRSTSAMSGRRGGDGPSPSGQPNLPESRTLGARHGAGVRTSERACTSERRQRGRQHEPRRNAVAPRPGSTGEECPRTRQVGPQGPALVWWSAPRASVGLLRVARRGRTRSTV